MTGAELARDEKIKKRIAKLNKIVDDITTQFVDTALPEEKRDRAFFDCWFLSLAMIQMLLIDVHSADEFVKNLRTTKNISFGTGNFYCEHAMMKRRNLNLKLEEVPKNIIWQAVLPWTGGF